MMISPTINNWKKLNANVTHEENYKQVRFATIHCYA